MHHGPAVKLGEDNASKYKEKLGLKLFFAYLFIYCGFVVIGLFYPESMGMHVLGEQNLAVVYGFGLIVLAIIVGFIYNAMCTKKENELNK